MNNKKTKSIFKNKIKHGLSNHILYDTFTAMKQRCYNKNLKNYEDYGGRGIEICDEWLDKENGFMNFYLWSLNNGWNKGLSIDRVNVNGNYEPSNCRWTDIKTQNNNKRNNKLITFNKETLTLAQWSSKTGIPSNVILKRLNNKWSIEKALTYVDDPYNLKISESGVRGIIYSKERNKWLVYCGIGKNRKYVGSYHELQNAKIAHSHYLNYKTKIKEKDIAKIFS